MDQSIDNLKRCSSCLQHSAKCLKVSWLPFCPAPWGSETLNLTYLDVTKTIQYVSKNITSRRNILDTAANSQTRVKKKIGVIGFKSQQKQGNSGDIFFQAQLIYHTSFIQVQKSIEKVLRSHC